MSLTITKPDLSALGALAFTAQRGVPATKIPVAIKNTGIVAVSGTFVTLYAEKTPGSGDYDTSGHPVLDERMGRFQITGVDSTVTAGQFALLGQVQPLGHLAVGVLPTILPGDILFADLWLEQASSSAGGGSVNIKIEVAGESPARPVPAGLTMAARGIDSGLNQSKSFMLTGRGVSATGTPDALVHAAVGSWLLNGVEYADASIEDLTLNQNDGAAAALTTGQSYIALITQGAATVPTITKGLKGTTPVAPSAPAGEILLAVVDVKYGASGSIIAPGDITQAALTYGRYLVVAHATGLAADVYAGEALTNSFQQSNPLMKTVVLVASATNRIWLQYDGSLVVTQTTLQPTAGAILLATCVTDPSNVTSTTDNRIFIGAAGALTPHAATHATGGSDPVSPASIGAAPLASPAFTGNPTAPTQTALDNSTKLATTAYVDAAAAALVLSGLPTPQAPVFFTGTGSTDPGALSPVPHAGYYPRVYKGGIKQREGGGLDYARTGANLEQIVFTTKPGSGELVEINYEA
jgi:hypothetical protein